MKDKKIWWIILAVGIIPFTIPFLCFLYEMINASSWSLIDWLVLYSFVYWPTYVVGIVLIFLSACKLRK